MDLTPFDYQVEGAAHLLSGRFRYLADEMGLGKSIQAILAILESGAATAAVICPASVVANWEREWSLWGDPEIEFKVYSYASSAVKKRLVEADFIVLDEAHYVKNRKAKRSGNALAIAARADRAVLLSGTPARNMSELWTVFNALWPELLKDEFRSYDDWLRYFCLTRPIRLSAYTIVPKVTGHRQDTVPVGRALLQQVMLRRTIKDVALQLPDLRVTLHRLPKDKTYEEAEQQHPQQFALLQQEQLLASAGDSPNAATLRRVLGALKAPAIVDLIAGELEDKAYEKIVLGYYHRDAGDILEAGLSKFGVVRLDGNTHRRNRQPLIDKFNTDPGTRVFLGQMIAAGEGLNLQAQCNEIALVEPAWTPDPNRQFIKRVHRIGQNVPVRARIFSVADTQDEKVMQNVMRDINMQQEIGL